MTLFTLQSSLLGDEKAKVSVFDIMGKIQFYADQHDMQSMSNTIDVSQFKAGVYFIKIASENTEQMTKLVVQ